MTPPPTSPPSAELIKSEPKAERDSQFEILPENQPETWVRRFEICNKRGLHARASARFVKLVSSFKAMVEVEKDGITVGGTSIMGLMLLAASPGCAIIVRATGEEAVAVLDALEKLIEDRFGEEC